MAVYGAIGKSGLFAVQIDGEFLLRSMAGLEIRRFHIAIFRLDKAQIRTPHRQGKPALMGSDLTGLPL
jgi:hypothetical protein